MKIYDLTHKIENDMTVYSEEEKPHIKSLFSFKIHGFNVTSLNISSHIGTHIDVPLHMIENGKNICDFPVETFFGKGLCISFEELKNFNFENLKNIDYLLIYTGWDKFWNNSSYFKNYPVISKEIILKILSYNLKGIGIDCISPDSYSSEEMENHKLLLKNNKIIVENLFSLKNLLGKDFYFSCMPLKTESDGCPVRAAAIIF